MNWINHLRKKISRFSHGMKFRQTMVFASIAWLSCATALAQTPAQHQPGEVELLRDPVLLHGVTQGFANTLPQEDRESCFARWQAKGITKAKWEFWEISESQYFAHNPNTPEVLGPGHYHWETADHAKQLTIRDGVVRMIYDTSKEWREGGRLNLPDKEGNRPKYDAVETSWPHFLIGQVFTHEGNQSEAPEDDQKIIADGYVGLRFKADVRLNRLKKSSEWDHSSDFETANHALFYIVFTVMPVASKSISEPGKIYILVPAIYSEGDGHVKSSAPWIGFDQFGDSVYFTDSQPKLKAGEWVSYDFDMKKLIQEGLAAVEKEARAKGVKKSYRTEDYFLAKFIIGWEKWGGFDTDVEFKGLSLRGKR